MKLGFDEIVKRYKEKGILIGNLSKLFSIDIHEDTRIVDFEKEENGIQIVEPIFRDLKVITESFKNKEPSLDICMKDTQEEYFQFYTLEGDDIWVPLNLLRLAYIRAWQSSNISEKDSSEGLISIYPRMMFFDKSKDIFDLLLLWKHEDILGTLEKNLNEGLWGSPVTGKKIMFLKADRLDPLELWDHRKEVMQ